MADPDQVPPKQPGVSAAVPRGAGAIGSIDPDELRARIEAILVSVDKPVPPARLAEAVGLTEPAHDENGETFSASREEADRAIADAIDRLNSEYESTGRTFAIEHVAGGYRLMTRGEYSQVVSAFHRSRAPAKLSRAALETLAIIAYKQPITKAGVEAIRGVSCGEVLKTLMDRGLVTIRGRAEELGRPMLYGTTKRFLDVFGLASLKDLPSDPGAMGEQQI